MRLQGKRKVYDLEQNNLIIETNDFSAFGTDFKTPIPYRSETVTKLSAFWFDYTKDIVPNYMISMNSQQLPKDQQVHGIFGDFMITKKYKELPVYCKVWGYLTGHAYRDYNSCGSVCGVTIPPGFKEGEQLYQPLAIFVLKDSNECISYDSAIRHIDENIAFFIRLASLKLYQKASNYLENKDILLYNTSFEFGIDENDNLMLVGAPLNPENSHFEAVDSSKSLYFWNNAYIKNFFFGKSCNVNIPKAILPHVETNQFSAIYINSYEMITGNDYFDYDSED